jgi:hypothetical protein
MIFDYDTEKYLKDINEMDHIQLALLIWTEHQNDIVTSRVEGPFSWIEIQAVKNRLLDWICKYREDNVEYIVE